MDALTSAIVQRAYPYLQKQQRDRLSTFNFAFVEMLLQRYSAPVLGLDALYNALAQAAAIDDCVQLRAELLSILKDDYIVFRECVDDRLAIRTELKARFVGLPPNIFTEIVFVLSESVSDESQIANLVVLTPAIAQIIPDQLPIVAEIAVQYTELVSCLPLLSRATIICSRSPALMPVSKFTM